MLGRPRRGLWLSLAAGLVVWNLVFDHQVQLAAREYAREQRLYAAGVGKSAPIESVMGPALRRSAGLAAVWAGVAVVATAVLARSLERRRRIADRSP
jgi:predicted secreted protein